MSFFLSSGEQKRTVHIAAAILLLVFSCFLVPAAFAQPSKSPIVIRDTEIENILKGWAEPVIKAAGLDPAAVNIILIQNRDINAFVAGGPNVFLYTGLIERSVNATEVIGVLAHEIGHIRGGHLVSLSGAMKNASYESVIGTLLGIGAAIATGNGDLGAAVVAGSQSSAMSRFLSFSRVQEASADQAALGYMEQAEISPEGLVTFLHKMETQEALPASQQNEYIRTHPLTRNRIDAMAAGLARSEYRGNPPPAEWEEQHRRVLAKLKSFITPERVAWDYNDRDRSVAADYARAVAAYRQNRVDEALQRIDDLIKREPENPYFLELKGQMLVDFGRVEEALPYYKQAVNTLEDAPLIRTAYAHALIESDGNNKLRLNEAIRHLDRARQDDPRSSRIYRLLATAYGRSGDESLAKLYLAEEALLKRETDYARRQAQSALAGLQEGSGPWLRAKDILGFIEQEEKKG